VALLLLATFLAATPVTALVHAAEPVTLGDWMRTIFVSPDREIDRSPEALTVALPAPPPVALQTSSEQTPPKQPMVRDRLPEVWVRAGSRRSRRRRRKVGFSV
jgi:hypothetical protein